MNVLNLKAHSDSFFVAFTLSNMGRNCLLLNMYVSILGILSRIIFIFAKITKARPL